VASQFSRTSRSLAKDTSALAMITWLFALVVLIGWLSWFVFGRVTVYEQSRNARLEAQQSAHPVAALVANKIASNTLTLGQEVQQGEVLIRLDASREELRLREELSRLEAIEPKIASLKREMAALEQASQEDQRAAVTAAQGARFRSQEASAAVVFAKDNERRLKDESVAGSVAAIDALRASAETEKLSATRDALVSDIQRLQNDAQARAHLQQAQIENLTRSVIALEGERTTAAASVARLRQDIDELTVRAPVSGTIGDLVPLRNGAFVAAGQKLATVIPRGGWLIVADFQPAAVLGRIQPGQRGRMRLDGFPWSEFGTLEARVVRVASELRDGLVRVEFTPELPLGSRLVLQHGLPGTIEVSLEQASPAVLVLRAIGHLSFDTRRDKPVARVTAS
jgi:membrane fusion protein, adhesin transport system